MEVLPHDSTATSRIPRQSADPPQPPQLTACPNRRATAVSMAAVHHASPRPAARLGPDRKDWCQMATRKARLRVAGVAFLLAMCLVPPHTVETLRMASA